MVKFLNLNFLSKIFFQLWLIRQVALLIVKLEWELLVTSLTSLRSAAWLISMRTTVLCPCTHAQWMGLKSRSSARLGSASARQNKAQRRDSPVMETICNTVWPNWKARVDFYKCEKFIYTTTQKAFNTIKCNQAGVINHAGRYAKHFTLGLK